MRWTTENLTTESALQMIRKIPIFTALKMKAVISSIIVFCRKIMQILHFKMDQAVWKNKMESGEQDEIRRNG